MSLLAKVRSDALGKVDSSSKRDISPKGFCNDQENNSNVLACYYADHEEKNSYDKFEKIRNQKKKKSNKHEISLERMVSCRIYREKTFCYSEYHQ